jgi:hypothetical protein
VRKTAASAGDIITSRRSVSVSANGVQEFNLLNSVSVSANTTDYKPVSKSNGGIGTLFQELQDLVNPEYKAWYYKKFMALGRERILILAAIARADAKTDKRKYFSVMLGNEQ